ncbi:MAG: 2Fe-2S iron-sulfur cluster binding domain-containing protein [Alphaproteobacteria bacterium]|nr:2Fe-2S iron-sulfur cluster binding domain-containing protein [Alphaproteobacteria bacterium]
MVPTLVYGGVAYLGQPGESVLAALLRQGVDLPYSCRKGTCLTCVLRAESGAPPATAQDGLRTTLREQATSSPALAFPKATWRSRLHPMRRSMVGPRCAVSSGCRPTSAGCSSIRQPRSTTTPGSSSTSGGSTG